MQADKVQTLLEFFKKKIPKDDYYRLEDALFAAPDKHYERILNCRLLSIKKYTLISVFLGFFAVDRFMLKDYVVGVLKIIGNLLFLGVAYFADLYFFMKKVKEINAEKLFSYF